MASDSALDDLGIPAPFASSAAASSPAPSGPPPLPQETDPYLLARTALVEGDQNNPESWQNVAGVVLNRAAKSGKSVSDVLAEPHAFEAYGNGKIQGVDTSSPQFKAALAAIQPVVSGQVKVPYDSFYRPDIVAHRGSTPPFDPSAGTKIGTQLFGNGYTPAASGSALDDLGVPATYAGAGGGTGVAPAQAAPADPAAPPAFVYDPNANVTRRPDGSILALGQVTNYEPEGAGGISVLGGPSKNAPNDDPAEIQAWLQAHPNDPANHPQAAPVEAKGNLNQLAAGGATGLQSVGETFQNADAAASRALPILGRAQLALGYDPQAGASGAMVNRLQSDQAYAGSVPYGIGRFLGEAAPTIPLMLATDGAAGALLGPAADASWGVDALGAGGNSLVGNVTRSVGGMVANGARQGGEAALLSSGGSDQPLTTQLAQGMAGGAVLGPVLGGLGAGGKFVGGLAGRALEPFTQGGREQIANRVLRQFAEGGPTDLNTTNYVPGSMPTLAQATSNPGLATLERSVRDVQTNAFGEREGANADARNALLDGIRGDDFTLGEAQSARDAATTPALKTAFAGAAPADASPVVAAIDRTLATPQGQEPEVRAALSKARGNLVGSADGLSSNDQAAFERGVSNTFGENAPSITTDVMNRAKTRIGSVFDQVAGNTTIPDTDPLLARLGEIGHAAGQELSDSDLKPILSQIQNIGSTINDGAMSGASYQALTRSGTPLARAASSPNPNIRYYAGQIKDALDDALQGAAAPEDQAALSAARSQYRNMKTVEAALPNSSDQPLDPAKLLAAVRRVNPNYAYRGGGDLGDVAQNAYTRAQPRTVLESDPAVLHGVRQDLDAVVQKGGTAADQVFPVRNAMDDALEQSAPGYRAAMGSYNAASIPIREQQFLQGLNLTDMRGNTTLGRVSSVLNRIEAARAAPGSNDAKTLSDSTLSQLYGLRDDLQRAGNSSLGKSIGSNTVQNLATNNLMAQGGIPMAAAAAALGHHPLVAPILFGGRLLYKSQNEDILNRLTNKLLNPGYGAAALAPAAPAAAGLPGTIIRGVNDNLTPAAVIAGQNALQTSNARR